MKANRCIIKLRALAFLTSASIALAESASAAKTKTSDADHDGLPDEWEVAHGLDPKSNDSRADKDGDGLTNLQEYKMGLNPSNPDTDGDGLYDGDEVALHLDPKVPSPDKVPPTAPTELRVVKAKSDSISLSWKASKDNLKVSGYLVYRDGQTIDTKEPIRGTSFTDTNLPDDEEFDYSVRAFDFSGNLSPPSSPLPGKTLPAETSEVKPKQSSQSIPWDRPEDWGGEIPGKKTKPK